MRNTPRILIVDDTPMNVELIECVLPAEGFVSRTSHDGPTAFAISHAERPDLIDFKCAQSF